MVEKDVVNKHFLLVCVAIATVVSFCMGPPDVISQLTSGVISGTLCLVLVWGSQKGLSKIGMSRRTINIVSICWMVLAILGPHVVMYLIYKHLR